MKKAIATLILSSSALAANAFEVGVEGVHDYGVHKNGYRATTEIYGVDLSATHMGHSYNRVTVGKDFDLYKLGNATFSAGAALAYQNTLVSKVQNGYGAVIDADVTIKINKKIDAVAGIEHFTGQSQIKSFNGNAATIGLNVKF
jgi:hypothetical protein